MRLQPSYTYIRLNLNTIELIRMETLARVVLLEPWFAFEGRSCGCLEGSLLKLLSTARENWNCAS